MSDLVVPGVRIGCDVVALGEIEESLRAFGERFISRVFTPDEAATCVGANRVPRLAARFAAKEAAIKALALPSIPTPPREIEVTSESGVPALRLHGSIAEHARAQGWRDMRVSLSHTDCHAMAMVAVSIDAG